ncbi:conserved protein of unknown function [Pseudomonas marincola]|uniref:Uncharacterized protein n=1 Tax=Pseudomonas marincola TaxID=437900 RepID=A0A653E5V1_9PSED|nr:conserved protein of unknown function [Pseudomonas marincola]
MLFFRQRVVPVPCVAVGNSGVSRQIIHGTKQPARTRLESWREVEVQCTAHTLMERKALHSQMDGGI